MTMSKAEIVAAVAAKTSFTKTDAQKAVEATLEAIQEALQQEQEVRFLGFGSFSVQKVAAREGRNPRTGETMQLAASNRPVFKAGKDLKQAVNPS